MKKMLGGYISFHKNPCIISQSLLKFLERPMKIVLEVFKSFEKDLKKICLEIFRKIIDRILLRDVTFYFF
jgi:hypothetical protein